MFQKVTEPFIEIPVFSSLTLIGDPGCDGLGAATMSIFAKALHNSSADLTLILGDIVPTGAPRYYRSVITFINQIAQNRVYTLCGNHDTVNYETHCGLRNYALYSTSQLIIILDNSDRSFTGEALELLETALKEYVRDEIIVAFHIPPPNGFTGNSVSPEEWEKVRTLLDPVKRSVSAVVTGHVHSFFREEVDGFPLIVSGGGGARIVFVHHEIPEHERVYHSLDYLSGGRFDFIPLDSLSYTSELKDAGILERLETAYINETQAHFRYKLYAEQMDDIGNRELAHLFRALSDAEYFHAKNHYSALNSVVSKEQLLESAIAGESYEVNEMYRDDLEYSSEKGMGLSEYSFTDSLEAERVHLSLLKEAQRGEFSEKYHTCISCGFTFGVCDESARCPVCGAPRDKIREVV